VIRIRFCHRPLAMADGSIRGTKRTTSTKKRIEFTGKITGLIFDRFGDFEGFLLDTKDGDRRFTSREREVEELAERVWRCRLNITVWTERDEPHRALSIIVHQPPASFGSQEAE